MIEHPEKHFAGKEIDILREHTEDEAVNEMCDGLRVMSARPQARGEIGEACGRALREGLAREPGSQFLRVR